MRSDVVLLPGLHGTTALFEAFVALAPAWARCRPTALPEGPDQGFDSLAEALAPTLAPLEGFVLLAESFSGPIAARLSRLLGAKVALLVLCNPLTQVSIRVPTRWAASVMKSPLLPTWPIALAMAGGRHRLGAAVLREARKLSTDVLASRIGVATQAVASDLVSNVSSPLLSILGTSDLLIPPGNSRGFLASVPYSTLVELPAPHLIVQTKPAEVWKAISEEFENAA